MKECLTKLAHSIWTLLTVEERMDWACGDSMYNYVEAVARLIFDTRCWRNMSEQDQDAIVNAIYEEEYNENR